jgi:hypothetical protein
MIKMAVVALVVYSLASAQQGSIQQSSRDRCAVNVVGNNNRVFTCDGIDDKTARQILSILNRIVGSQPDREAVMAKLDDIQKGVEDIRQSTAHRNLSNAQKAALAKALLPMAGHRVSVDCIMGDTEGKDLALDFVEAFRMASWTGVEGSGVNQGVYDKDPAGIQIMVSSDDVEANTVPPEAQAVFQAIRAATGVELPGTKGKIPRGEVHLVVGKKN